MSSNSMNETYVESMETASNSEALEVMNMEATHVADVDDQLIALSCCGTLGTLGTAGGCIGTLGTFGCAG